VSDCCLTPHEQFFSSIMARTSYIRWDDVHFVLDQRALLYHYSASSKQKQSTHSILQSLLGRISNKLHLMR